jgi:hypothetical protein
VLDPAEARVPAGSIDTSTRADRALIGFVV